MKYSTVYLEQSVQYILSVLRCSFLHVAGLHGGGSNVRTRGCTTSAINFWRPQQHNTSKWCSDQSQLEIRLLGPFPSMENYAQMPSSTKFSLWSSRDSRELLVVPADNSFCPLKNIAVDKISTGLKTAVTTAHSDCFSPTKLWVS